MYYIKIVSFVIRKVAKLIAKHFLYTQAQRGI
jgi:hypothetical protein